MTWAIRHIRRIYHSITSLFASTSSIECDGVNQHMSIPNDADIFPAEYTRAGWAWVANTSDNQPLFSSLETGEGAYLLRVSGNNVQYYHTESDLGSVGTTVTPTSSVGIVAYEWNHYAVVADGTDITTYINGVAVGTVFAYDGTAYVPPTKLAYYGNDRGVHAEAGFDTCCLFNTGMTARQVKELYTLKDVSQHSIASTNLVYWHDFEDAGSSIEDKSGNGHTGTLVNSPTKISYQPYPYDYQLLDGWAIGGSTYNNATPYQNIGGFALTYDGTNDYVTFGDSSSFSFTSGGMSVSAWVKSSVFGTDLGAILSKYQSGLREWMLYVDASGHLKGIIYDEDLNGYIMRTYAAQLPNDQWLHVCMTYSGGTSATDIKLYVNGVQVDDTTTTVGSFTSLRDTTATMRISNYQSAYLASTQTDTMLLDKELSSAEVIQVFNNFQPRDETQHSLSSNLVMYERGITNATGSNNVVDQSGNGNHGTMTNMVAGDVITDYPRTTNSFQTDDDEGSYDYNGTTQYVNCGTSSTLNFGNATAGSDTPFTFSAWVKMDDATDFEIISRGTYGTNGEYQFLSDSTDKLALLCIDDSTDGFIRVQSDVTLTSYQNEWIHVAGTYDGGEGSSGMTLYLNGAVYASTANDSGSYTAMEDLSGQTDIARRNASSFADGSICHVSVWDVELNIFEIQEIYNNGSPTLLTSHTKNANLVSWWKTDGSDSGSTATDSAGSNNGTYTNTPTFISGPGDYPNN